MSSLQTTLELLGLPLLCALSAGGLLAVWFLRRSCRYLLWQALGMLLLGVAYVLAHHVQVPWSARWMVDWVLWGAAWAVAQAIVTRYGQSLNAYVVVLSAVCMLVVVWFSTVAEQPAHTHWMVISMAMGLVLAYALPLSWRSTVRHHQDRWLRGLYSFSSVLVLLGPLLLSQAIFVPMVLALAVMFSALLAGCAWRDGASKPRTFGYRDAATHLLNRSGLDVVCGALPAASGITVVVLCELRGKQQRARKASVACSALTLQFFAQLLQRSVREGDFVARIGAEEFVLALRDLDMAQAQALVARIETQLPRFSLLESCRASFGLAQVHEMDSLDMALHRADVALYQSKEEEVHGEPLVSVA